MVKLVAGKFSRAERARQRANIDLEDAALTPATQQRYYLALRKVLPYVEKASCEEDIDAQVCHWVRRMWRSGDGSPSSPSETASLHCTSFNLGLKRNCHTHGNFLAHGVDVNFQQELPHSRSAWCEALLPMRLVWDISR